MGTKSKWKKGRLTFYNDAVVDSNVVTTTAAGTLNAYGLSVITSSAAATYTLGVPEAGMTKDIVVGSSWVATVRCSTVANLVTILSPSSDNQNGVVLTPGSTYTASVTLRGVSTVLWALTGVGTAGSTLMAGNTVELTTACT